jgi:hypothetical protein
MAFKKAVDQAKAEQQPQQTQNHFQHSAEKVGEGVKNTLVTQVAEPMAVKMADAIFAEALRLTGEKLKNGETGELTQSMLNSLSAGVTRPFENWTNQIETWYEPVALLPGSPESTQS